MAELEARWRASIAPTARRLDLPDAAARRATRTAGGSTTASRSAGCGASSRSSAAPTRGDLVSEAGTQIGIARPGAVPAPTPAVRPTPTAAAPVELAPSAAALAAVMDPELPMLSIVDLGIVHRVEVAPDDGVDPGRDPADVRRLPALELIKLDRGAARAFGRPVEVTATFEVPVDLGADQPGRTRALLRPGSRRRRRVRAAAVPT